MIILVSINALPGIGIFPVELVTTDIHLEAAEERFDFLSCLGRRRESERYLPYTLRKAIKSSTSACFSGGNVSASRAIMSCIP